MGDREGFQLRSQEAGRFCGTSRISFLAARSQKGRDGLELPLINYPEAGNISQAVTAVSHEPFMRFLLQLRSLILPSLVL